MGYNQEKKKEWTDAVREKYLSEEEAFSPAGWETVRRRVHRTEVVRRSIIAAAAVLLPFTALLLWSPWQKSLPSSEDITAVSETTTPAIPPSNEIITNPTDIAPTASLVSKPAAIQSIHKDAQATLTAQTAENLTSTSDDTTSHSQLPSRDTDAEPHTSVQQVDEPSDCEQPTYRQSLDDPFADLLANEELGQQKKHRISVSLVAGTKPVQQDKGIPARVAPYFAGLTYLNCSPGVTPSVKSSVSNTSRYYYYYMASNYGGIQVSPTEIGQYHHDFPITIGLQARLELLSWLGIQSGIEYTYLHSIASSIMANVDQRLHFVGIPLRFDARLWSNHRWEVYAGLGGKTEKCVSATYGNLICEEPRLQWAAEAFGGIQYRIWDNTSLYFQPELSWYFTKTDLVTYRTEHPLGITLNAGLSIEL